MKKLCLALVIIMLTLSVFGCRKKNIPATTTVNKNPVNQVQPPSKNELEQAKKLAQTVYQQKKSAGLDFSQGPCLSEELMPGWVLDIARSPRLTVDNQKKNQCRAYLEGKAWHFIELDPEGNFIRAL